MARSSLSSPSCWCVAVADAAVLSGCSGNSCRAVPLPALAACQPQCSLSACLLLLLLQTQVLGDHELEPMSRSLLAAPHSMCELRALLCKTVITVADILLKPLPYLQTVLYAISCGLIFYYHARMVGRALGC